MRLRRTWRERLALWVIGWILPDGYTIRRPQARRERREEEAAE